MCVILAFCGTRCTEINRTAVHGIHTNQNHYFTKSRAPDHSDIDRGYVQAERFERRMHRVAVDGVQPGLSK